MSWNGQSRIDRAKEAAIVFMAEYQVAKSIGQRLDTRQKSSGY
jgi:hypothetical protein